jgi:hypothetical protein
MDQNHSHCPYLGRQQSFSYPINQHITGSLQHGKAVTFYRTVNNIHKGADLTIYCILREIENWFIQHSGVYPEIIFLQIDGGSENANKYVLSMCEYLVTKRLARLIFYTRLPTGHTHEDIDAKFGHLWKHISEKPILTLEAFKSLAEDAFANSDIKSKVEDVYIIPDYKSFFDQNNSIDPRFKNYTKKEATQHQWRFQFVEKSVAFPFGCRTQYRAYASDNIIEFSLVKPENSIDAMGSIIGLEPVNVKIDWFPKGDTFQSRKGIDGFYLLCNIPYLNNRNMKPLEFVENSYIEIAKVLNAVRSKWPQDHPVNLSWENWNAQCPLATCRTSVSFISEYKGWYKLPLVDFFLINKQYEPKWLLQKSFNEYRTTSGTKEYVSRMNVAVATASVESFWNTDVPPTRIVINNNEQLLERLALVSSRCELYLDYLNSLTKDQLIAIVKNRVDEYGKIKTVNVSKKLLIQTINSYNKSYFTKLFGDMPAEQIHIVEDTFSPTRLTLRNEMDNIIATCSHENQVVCRISRRQLIQLKPYEKVPDLIVNYIMRMNNIREKKNLKKFQNANNNLAFSYVTSHCFDVGFVPSNETEIETSQFQLECKIPNQSLSIMKALYFPFRIEDSNDSLIGIIVEIQEKSITLIGSGFIIETEQNRIILHFKTKIISYLRRYMVNFHENEWTYRESFADYILQYEIALPNLESEIYWITIVDMLSHSCPIIFQQADTNHLRYYFCFQILLTEQNCYCF